MKKSAAVILQIMLLGTALTVVSCGASNDGSGVRVAQQLGPVCGTGQFAIGTQPCYSAPTFADACIWAGGVPVSAGTICKLTYDFGSLSRTVKGGTFPNLTPSYSTSGFSTGISVRVGDKVEFRSSSKWGEQSGFLGTSCDYVANGLGQDYDTGFPLALNEGYPQGMVISNGTEIYAATTDSTSGPVQTIQFSSAGLVRYGFNVPYGTGSCYGFTINVMRLIHCEDASRNTVPCP